MLKDNKGGCIMIEQGTKAVRIFTRKSDNQIVWTHELRGPGEFPISLSDDLKRLPGAVVHSELDAEGNMLATLLGGKATDYQGVEIKDAAKAVVALDGIKIGEKTINPEWLEGA